MSGNKKWNNWKKTGPSNFKGAPQTVKIKFQNGGLACQFKYDPCIIECIKGIAGRSYDKETKQWHVPFEQKLKLETAFRVNRIKFECDGLAIQMANGEYRLAQPIGDTAASQTITAQLEVHDEKHFAVRYTPVTPILEMLNELAENVYMTMRDESTGIRLGRYDDGAKSWLFPISCYEAFVDRFQRNNMKDMKLGRLPESLEKIIKNHTLPLTGGEVKIDAPGDIVDKMYPFQRAGVEAGIRMNGRIMIADEMGLGKTVQAIVLAYHYRADWPLLIVSPSSVKFNWLVELTNWLPMLDSERIVALYTGKDVKDITAKTQIVITSYQMVSEIIKRLDKLKQEKKDNELSRRDIEFGTVILDESHYIKSGAAKRTKDALQVCHNAKRVMLLSGTPALARPIELFTQISAIDKTIFTSKHNYGLRYCQGHRGSWGWEYKGASNMQELKLIMSLTVMVRRLKSEVLTQLPAKLRKIIHIQLPKMMNENSKESKEAKRYAKLFSNMEQMPSNSMQLPQEWIEGDSERAEQNGLAVFGEWYKKTGVQKVEPVADYVIEKLKNVEKDEKVIVFAHHKDVISALSKVLDSTTIDEKPIKFITIDGSTKAERRTLNVHDFQNNPDIRVALLSITAANMGITLTAATTVLFAELHFTPGILAQAEDRAHRIGRDGTVSIEYLLARGTADDWIWGMIEKKLDTLESAGLESSATKDQVVDLDQEKENQKNWDDDEGFEALAKHHQAKPVKEILKPRRQKKKDPAEEPGQLKMVHFYDKTPVKSSKKRPLEDATPPPLPPPKSSQPRFVKLTPDVFINLDDFEDDI